MTTNKKHIYCTFRNLSSFTVNSFRLYNNYSEIVLLVFAFLIYKTLNNHFKNRVQASIYLFLNNSNSIPEENKIRFVHCIKIHNG